jgi:hypothetical protein
MISYTDCGTLERTDNDGDGTGQYYYFIIDENNNYYESFKDYNTREEAIIELEKILKDEDNPCIINFKDRG